MPKKKNYRAPKRTFPKFAWIGLAFVILAVVVGVILLTSQPKEATLPAEITVAQAVQKRDQGAFILDVREPSEWVQFHIPGATLIPLGQLPNRMNEVPKDKVVVVVCRTGNRSMQGRDILAQAGYQNVTSMAGGVTAWQSLGYPITTGE